MWHDHHIDFARWLHLAVWHVALESWQWIHQVAAPCNVAGGSGMTCHGIRPNVRHIGILRLVSISTCHSAPVCKIDTIALHCLVFEKIAFCCILATDRQTTDRRTDGQHRCTKPPGGLKIKSPNGMIISPWSRRLANCRVKRTALKRCNKTESLQNKKCASLSSPECVEIRFPRFCTNSRDATIRRNPDIPLDLFSPGIFPGHFPARTIGQFPPFAWCRTFPPFHRHHPPIYNIKRSIADEYKIDSS